MFILYSFKYISNFLLVFLIESPTKFMLVYCKNLGYPKFFFNKGTEFLYYKNFFLYGRF